MRSEICLHDDTPTDEHWENTIPFLADPNIGDLILFGRWGHYIIAEAHTWLRRSKYRNESDMWDMLDPRNYDMFHPDRTFYEKLADCEKYMEIAAIVHRDLIEFKRRETIGAVFWKTGILQDIESKISNTSWAKYQWQEKREEIVIHQQRIRIEEFAVLINRWFYKRNMKCNPITKKILDFVFKWHPSNLPDVFSQTTVVDLTCDELFSNRITSPLPNLEYDINVNENF